MAVSTVVSRYGPQSIVAPAALARASLAAKLPTAYPVLSRPNGYGR
jgi:hypothetical protein